MNDIILFTLISIILLVVIIFIIILLRAITKLDTHIQTIEKINQQYQQNQLLINGMLEQKLTTFQISLNDISLNLQQTLANNNTLNEQKLEYIRSTLDLRLSNMQNANTKQLDEMRQVVDEKLQKTLEERITQSFLIVNERLEQVAKGLGEMSILASGVGDLKKVLTNVKTKGILGETQLSAILQEMLAPSQYLSDVATVKGSNKRVEFAIKLPNDNKDPILLPIDSKFPLENYWHLVEAFDKGDLELVESYHKKLEANLKQSAKEIQEKYVRVPETTDFAILFVPIEGLFAEVVRKGLVEVLQRDYHVLIAGPTTLSALLNSLQMGFKTLAIQQHSQEVWQLLASVKDEFNNFAGVLSKHQERLSQANEELDKLVGVRTRKLVTQLNKIDIIDNVETLVIDNLVDDGIN